MHYSKMLIPNQHLVHELDKGIVRRIWMSVTKGEENMWNIKTNDTLLGFPTYTGDKMREAECSVDNMGNEEIKIWVQTPNTLL